jgi:hypothetical protein
MTPLSMDRKINIFPFFDITSAYVPSHHRNKNQVKKVTGIGSTPTPLCLL